METTRGTVGVKKNDLVDLGAVDYGRLDKDALPVAFVDAERTTKQIQTGSKASRKEPSSVANYVSLSVGLAESKFIRIINHLLPS